MFFACVGLMCLLAWHTGAIPVGESNGVAANGTASASAPTAPSIVASPTARPKAQHECYKQGDPEVSAEYPIARHIDCLRALQLVVGDKVQAPMVFSRNAEDGFQVPHEWSYGSCHLHIDITLDAPLMTVQLPMAAIVRMGAFVNNQCNSNPPAKPLTGLGGKSGLGGRAYLNSFDKSGGKLDVMIRGMKAPDIPPPPFLEIADGVYVTTE